MSLLSASLVAAGFVYLPGLVVARALGRHGWTAWGVAPAASVSVIVVAGGVCRMLGLTGTGAAMLAVSVAVTVLVAGGGWLASGRPDVALAKPPRLSWLPALPLVGGFLGTLWILGRAAGSATSWPQIHDTIFHIGTVVWLVRHESAWVGDVSEYAGISYPGVWHVLGAVVSGTSGADAMTASHAVLLIVVTVVWPMSCLFLVRTFVGRSPAIGATAVASAFVFYGMPFRFLTWGVVWPYLLSLALLPLVLGVLASVTTAVLEGRGLKTRDLLMLAMSTGACVAAHPSSAFGLLILGTPLVVSVALAAGRRRAGAALFVLFSVAATAAWLQDPVDRLTDAGADKSAFDAVDALVLMLTTVSSSPTAAILGLGCVVAGARSAWRRGQFWVSFGMAIPLFLSMAVLLLPHGLTVWATWPWYSDVLRIRGVAVVPAVLALAYLHDRILREIRPTARLLGAAGPPLGVALLAWLTLVAAAPIVADRYHPEDDGQVWASEAERTSLARLAEAIPPGSVVAADPFRGGTFLYLEKDVELLYPTADAPLRGDPQYDLLARQLRLIDSRSDVCQAAMRLNLTFLITGGDAHPDVAGLDGLFDGLSDISPLEGSFTPVMTNGVYTLWRVEPCRA